MSCEQFKSRLADFALGADDAEFRTHLESCATCKTALQSERELLARIDRGVATMVSAEPSGDFAVHVRRRIVEQAAARRPRFFGWMPITAASALALAILVAVLSIGRPPRPPQTVRVTPPAPIIAPTAKSPEAAAPPKVIRTEVPPSVAIGPREPRGGQMAANREPEVLVPRSEMAAVLLLFNANWEGKADGASLTAQAPPMSEALKLLTIADLKIPALEVVPLESREQTKGPAENR